MYRATSHVRRATDCASGVPLTCRFIRCSGRWRLEYEREPGAPSLVIACEALTHGGSASKLAALLRRGGRSLVPIERLAGLPSSLPVPHCNLAACSRASRPFSRGAGGMPE